MLDKQDYESGPFLDRPIVFSQSMQLAIMEPHNLVFFRSIFFPFNFHFGGVLEKYPLKGTRTSQMYVCCMYVRMYVCMYVCM